MRRISFLWTTPALLAGVKTVTRRDWDPGYGGRFAAGELVEAYDRNPAHGGRPIALIRLTDKPILESTRHAPDEDWEREGFAYLEEHGFKVQGARPRVLWEAWKRFAPADLWTVRFELIKTGPFAPDPRLMTPPREKPAPAGRKLL